MSKTTEGLVEPEEKAVRLTKEERMFIIDVVAQTNFRPGQSHALIIAEAVLEKLKD